MTDIYTHTFQITDRHGHPVHLRDRVRITGSHPHRGCEGTYLGIEPLVLGMLGLRVELDQCRHGTGGCYVFKAAEWEKVEAADAYVR